MKKFTFNDMQVAGREIINRFAVAIFFLLLLTMWVLLNIWDKVDVISEYRQPYEGVWCTLSRIQSGTIYYYLSIATVLSIALQFWAEEVANKKRMRLIWVVSHLALLADAAFLWCRPEGSIHTELILAHAALVSAIVIGGIFLPYHREKEDIASWNLTHQVVINTLVCPIACGLMTGGLILLFDSLDWLFGLKFSRNWNATIAVLMLLTLGMTMWMARLPKGDAKFNRKAYTSKFLTSVIRYLFLPLVLGYLVVLYLYGAKILLTFSLPQGGVCYLIHALMAGCLAIELLLYPLQRKVAAEGSTEHPFERWVVRWLPIIILPLLVLMTIAIGRRISDYGITVKRLYTLVLNLWYYAVCIGLFVSHAKRIHWIALSFAALFLLISALPVNVCSITRSVILDRIGQFMATHQHPELPMEQDAFWGFLDGLTEQESAQLRDDLRYVRDLYDHHDIAPFVAPKVLLWPSNRGGNAEHELYNYDYARSGLIEVPEGYHRVTALDLYKYGSIQDSTRWHICEDSLCFAIDFHALPKGTDRTREWLLPEVSGRGVLSIKRFTAHESDVDSHTIHTNIEGYYFEK